MIDYDRAEPLIFIHIPKTGGSSVRKVLQSWYGKNLHLHYPGAAKDVPLPDLAALHDPQNPAAVYGHFNNLRGFGVADRFPGVRQFVAIFRDPWEQRLSGYFYSRAVSDTRLLPAIQTEKDLRTFMLDTRLGQMTQLPGNMTSDNYRTMIDRLFIEVGITEKLAMSMQRIADKLGFPFDPVMLTHENVSRRFEVDTTIETEAFRREFRRVHELEYRVYEHVRNRYS